MIYTFLFNMFRAEKLFLIFGLDRLVKLAARSGPCLNKVVCVCTFLIIIYNYIIIIIIKNNECLYVDKFTRFHPVNFDKNSFHYGTNIVFIKFQNSETLCLYFLSSLSML